MPAPQSLLDLLARPRGANLTQMGAPPPMPAPIQNGPMNPMQIAARVQESPSDFGFMPPMDETLLMDSIPDVSPDMGDTAMPQRPLMPSTISGQIQQWLGAKPEEDFSGLVHDVLSKRANVTGSDVGRAAAMTLMQQQPVSSQDVMRSRVSDDLGLINNLARMRLDLMRAQGLGSGGGATMMAAQQIMEEAAASGNPISFTTAYSIAKSGLGQGMGMQGGQVGLIPGFGNQRQELKYNEGYGSQSGQNVANIQQGAAVEAQQKLGQITGEALGNQQKRSMSASQTLGLIEKARKLLPKATSGGGNALYAKGKAFFNVSDESTQADAALDLLSAGLTATIPRMEGPQSNFDVQIYQQAAADVGNRSKPLQDRLAALDVMESIQNKYAHLNMDTQGNGSPPADSLPPGWQVRVK